MILQKKNILTLGIVIYFCFFVSISVKAIVCHEIGSNLCFSFYPGGSYLPAGTTYADENAYKNACNSATATTTGSETYATCDDWNAHIETLANSPAGAAQTQESVKLDNPLGEGNVKLTDIVGNIIKIAMGIMGSITLVVFVFGAFSWITAAGSPEKVKTGINAMVYATIGIFIIFGSYAILATVLSLVG